MEKRITAQEIYGKLIDVVMGANIEEEEKDVYVEFLNKKIEQMEAKKAKDRERAALRKAEPDVLYEIVDGLFTYEPQTIKQLLAQVPADVVEELEVTKGKVAVRCRKILATGKIEKELVKDGKTSVVAYKLATNEE